MKAVNLLPNDQRGAAKVVSPAATPTKGQSGDGFGAYVVLGALALAVIAVASMVLTKNTINDRKAELASTEAQVQAVSREAAALKPYADFKQLADARVQTVQALASSRFDWEQALRDLSRALPSDARLDSFKGSVGGAAEPGAPGATAAATPTIDISGCTKSHTSVAKLMARLRAIRGVTRVSLKGASKSSTSSGGGGGAAAPAAAATGEGRCGSGNKPTWSMTIYFERFGVPAVNVPAGAAATGGPTGPTGATTPAGTAPAPGTPPTTQAPGTTPAAPAQNPATQGVSTP